MIEDENQEGSEDCKVSPEEINVFFVTMETVKCYKARNSKKGQDDCLSLKKAFNFRTEKREIIVLVCLE